MNKPNPGSPEALQMGCICPVIDNCCGKANSSLIKARVAAGMGDGFWIAAGCPVHYDPGKLILDAENVEVIK